MASDADKDSIIAQLIQNSFAHEGKIAALDMLLRPVWTQWALESSDPENYVTHRIEGLCESMSRVHLADDPATQKIFDEAEAFLRDFAANVNQRVNNRLTGGE